MGAWRHFAIWEEAVPVAPSGAALFLALGAAVAALLHAHQRSLWRTIGTVISSLACLVAVTVAFSNAPLGDMGTPDGIFTAGGIPVGRISPITAGLGALLAAGLLPLFGSRTNTVLCRAGKLAALVVTVCSMVVAAAYLTGTPLFYQSGLIPMAFLSAVALALLGAAALLAGGAEANLRLFFFGRTAIDVEVARAAENRRLFGLTTAAVLLLAAGAGVAYLRVQQRVVQARISAELTAIATLKIDQLVGWRESRLKDARVLMRSPWTAGQLQTAAAENTVSPTSSLDDWITALRDAYDCDSVVLLDSELQPLAVGDRRSIDGAHASALEAVLNREVHVTDLYRDSSGRIRLSIVVPVFRPDGATAGAILLQVDPNRFVFPLLQSWPTPSGSAETLLLRREGTGILYLNELRHRGQTALKLRWSGDDRRLLGVRVALGLSGKVVRARDYRGVEVVGTGRNVPGTSWFLVAKIDANEVFGQLWRQATLVGTATLAVLAAAAVAAAALWRRRNVDLLRRELAAERARKAAAERLNVVMQQANDIILVHDAHGSILEANERALATYGYTLAELRQLGPEALVSPAAAARRAAPSEPTARNGALVETMHRRRDGVEFPVEVSVRWFEIDGVGYSLGIYRDLTARKAAEHQIQRLSRVYAALSQVNQAIVRCQTRQDLYRTICCVLVEFGKFKSAWIGVQTEPHQELTPVAVDGSLAGASVPPEAVSAIHVETARAAFREARTHVWNSIASEDHRETWRDQLLQLGVGSAIALPILVHGAPFGALAVYSDTGGSFEAKEVALLEEAASDIAFALDGFDRREEQERTQAALRESEQRYRSLFANMVEGFAYCRMGYENGQPVDFTYVEVNAAFSALTGLHHVTGRRVSEVIPGIHNSSPELLQRYARVAESGEPERFEIYVPALARWFDISVYSPARGWFVAVFDVITARKMAEEAVHAAYDRLRQFVDSGIVGVAIGDVTGRILEANDYYLRLIGYNREELQGGIANWRLIAPAESLAVDETQLNRLLRGEPCPPFEQEYRRRDGSRVPVLIAVALLPGSKGRIAAFVLDVSELKRAEQRIRQQAELIDRANEAIVVSDLSNTVTFWSRGAERVFELKAAEALGRSAVEIFARGDGATLADVQRAFQNLDDWRGEIHGRPRDGRTRIITTSITVLRDEAAQPTGRLIISADITEQKQLEERYLRAQRLESIGMLAAGIAHDLNNVLAPIGMAASLLRDHVSDQSALSVLATLAKCTTRGAGLVRQILSFAQGISGEVKTIQVKHLVYDVTSMMTETFPRSIAIEPEVARELWTVRGNPTQIHQVLLNLCVNARDAMPNGGVLRVRAENCELDEAGARAIDGARPGAWLVLHVQDTGTGMPPDVLERIWDPFFTTKSPDKGTGLGLPTVLGIVETHRGFISVHSDVGQGTIFRVYLPAESASSAEPQNEAAMTLPAGRGELVLVADDEGPIRDLISQVLKLVGYRVLTANDGNEAAQIINSSAKDIALVLTDWDMPNMGGADLIRVIRAQAPHVKILVMSGIGATRSSSKAVPQDAGDGYLAKPFSASTLLVAVKSVIGK